MIKTIECNKICLKADKGKMLYNERIGTYTPKVYLHSENEESEWTEVLLPDVPTNEEPTETDYAEVGKILLGVSE